MRRYSAGGPSRRAPWHRILALLLPLAAPATDEAQRVERVLAGCAPRGRPRWPPSQPSMSRRRTSSARPPPAVSAVARCAFGLRCALLAALVLAAGSASAAASVQAPRPVHDRAYWLSLKAQDFKLPASERAAELAREVIGLNASTDPDVRDGVGYEAFVTWVYRDQLLTAAELRTLLPPLLASARAGLGEDQGDGIFARSFALLDLSVLAAEDLKRPFLSDAEFHELLEAACTALARERDLRGYVSGKGWAHATAHGADLLKFLARSPHLSGSDAARIVTQIAERLRGAGQVFVWGEDERLAAALQALSARPDFEAGWFEPWLTRLKAEHEALWQGPLDAARYVAVRAQLNCLAQLAARLPAGEHVAAAVTTLRQKLQELLAR